MRVAGILVIAAILLLPVSAYADLTGKWTCNDNGIYYIRQVDDEIWWYAQQQTANPVFANVAHGFISGNLIILRWADVPQYTNEYHGVLVLQVENENAMQAIENPGYGGSHWSR